jgi:hypothetical protein
MDYGWHALLCKTCIVVGATGIYVVGFGASLAADSTPAFACAAVEPSRSRTPAYQRVPGRAQCEGFFERSVSQPFVELVSLTFGAQLAENGTTQFEVHAAASVSARLLVQPMRSGPFYRVDAALERSGTLRWEAGPMMQATGLELRDIGFLALVQTANAPSAPPEYVPVTLVPAGGTASPGPTSPAQAVLRGSVRLSSVAWRASGSAGGTWREASSGPLYPYQRLVLPIQLPTGTQPVDIDVQALDAEGKPLPMLQFRILGAGGERS